MNNRPNEWSDPKPVIRNAPGPKHTSSGTSIRAVEPEIIREMLLPRVKIFQQLVKLLISSDRQTGRTKM